MCSLSLPPAPPDAYPITEMIYTWTKGPEHSVEVPPESSSLVQYDLTGHTVSSETIKSITGEAAPTVSTPCVIQDVSRTRLAQGLCGTGLTAPLPAGLCCCTVVMLSVAEAFCSVSVSGLLNGKVAERHTVALNPLVLSMGNALTCHWGHPSC